VLQDETGGFRAFILWSFQPDNTPLFKEYPNITKATSNRYLRILALSRLYLDNFKNRQVKEKDYSIGEVLQPDGRYAMYYEGGEKILLSPNEELVKVLKNMAPRKVFSE
jgi:hypothetical protein